MLYEAALATRTSGICRTRKIHFTGEEAELLQISRQELVLDILRNVTTKPADHVKKFSFKGSGGSYAKLFDGTEQVLSWDNVLWLNRSILLP